MSKPTYAELIAILENAQSVASIGLTEKRIDVILAALRIANAGVTDALEGLLGYTGGWDIDETKHADHPIVLARQALKRAGVEL